MANEELIRNVLTAILLTVVANSNQTMILFGIVVRRPVPETPNKSISSIAAVAAAVAEAEGSRVKKEKMLRIENIDE